MIVFQQEHFLTKANTDTLKRSPTHHTFVREAKKKTHDRSSRGLATLVRLAQKTELISSDHNLLEIKCSNMFFINVYMPCNRKNISSLSVFAGSCKRLRTLLLRVTNQGLNWIVAGDINAKEVLASSLDCL